MNEGGREGRRRCVGRCLCVCLWFVNMRVCNHVKIFCVTRRGDCLDDSKAKALMLTRRLRRFLRQLISDHGR